MVLKKKNEIKIENKNSIKNKESISIYVIIPRIILLLLIIFIYAKLLLFGFQRLMSKTIHSSHTTNDISFLTIDGLKNTKVFLQEILNQKYI